MPDTHIPSKKSLKKIHPTWTKFLLPGAVLIFLITGILLFYGLSWKNPRDYIPSKTITYLQVPSLNNLYDKLFNLEAADLALAGSSMAPLRTTINELRELNFSQDFFLSLFLDVKCDIILTNQGIPLVIMDLGGKSLLTRGYALLSQLTHLQPLIPLFNENTTLYELKTQGELNFYFYFLDNLVFITTDLPTLKSQALRTVTQEETVKYFTPQILDNLELPSESLKTLVQTQELLQEWVGKSPMLNKFLSPMDRHEESLVQLTLENRRVHMDFTMKVPTLFSVPAQKQNIWSRLPENTTYAYVSSARTIEESPPEGFQKYIYPWSGIELGIFGLETDPDPIFFIEIKDLPKLKSVLKNMAKDTPPKNPGLGQLQLPNDLTATLSLWNFPGNAPYYVMDELFLYLSPQIDPLHHLQDKTTLRLVDTPEFQVLQGNNPLIASFSSYYNLDRVTPFFLESKNLLTSVLRLYGQGLVLASPLNDQEIISLSAIKGRPALIRAVPNFPKSVGGKLISPVYTHTFPSDTFPKLIYLRNDGELQIMNPLNGDTITSPQDPETTIIPGGNLDGLFLSLGNGKISLINSVGDQIKPFPLQTPINFSFPPFIFNNQVVLVPRDSSTLGRIDHTGLISFIPLSAQVLTPPQTRFSLWGYLTKGSTPQILITDLRGTPQVGWPQPAPPDTISPPVFFKMGANPAVASISQKGELALWDMTGERRLDKPVIFSGEFSREPKVLRLLDGTEVLLLLNDEGLLRIFDPHTGKSEKETTLQGVSSKTLLTISDVNRDGKEEIFLYGESPFILGLDDNLAPLPEFPLRGHTQPQFTDLDKDGFIEMVTVGLDNKIYAYTLRF
ncbi:MAG: hypothetical protein A2Z96_04420 [Spirochaetes bacterium GWB1_48_6]|nr:MAG: hypothetical protein A2Z96_04420 [Spirochaetes bacterium GWB1_48_6]